MHIALTSMMTPRALHGERRKRRRRRSKRKRKGGGGEGGGGEEQQQQRKEEEEEEEKYFLTNLIIYVINLFIYFPTYSFIVLSEKARRFNPCNHIAT